jgi:hypothetical protein
LEGGIKGRMEGRIERGIEGGINGGIKGRENLAVGYISYYSPFKSNIETVKTFLERIQIRIAQQF